VIFLQKSWGFIEHAKWIGTTFAWIMYVQRYSILICLTTVYADWRFPCFLHFIKQILKQYLVHVDSTFTAISFHFVYSQKSSRLWSGDFAGHLTGPPHPVHCSPKAWFRCCPTMWGHQKLLVYSDLISDLEVLQQWVEHACWQICIKSGIFWVHTYENNSWKLRWHAWEPYTASVVMI